MAGGALGVSVVLYFLLFAAGLLITAVILRAVFRINKIVELLTSIDARLQGQTRGSETRLNRPPDPKEQQAVAVAPMPFRMANSGLSAGDRVETPDGRRWTVIDFPRMGLRVKDDQGKTEILPPSNNAFSRTKWTFEVRKIQ
jgi:hypothetical protein